jgi:hypothetical protein
VPILKRLHFAFHLRKDSLLLVATTLVSAVGGIFGVYKPSNALVAGFAAISVLTIAWALLPAFRSLKSPYTEFFNKPSQGIAWLRARLRGKNCRFHALGVREVTVMGIACSDIGDLFHEVVNAAASGIRFRVVMLDPEHPAAQPEGLLPTLEPRAEVAHIVQRPLGNQLQQLKADFEDDSAVQDRLSELFHELERSRYASHSVCIRVCTDLWYLADELARKRSRDSPPAIQVYFRNELPELRQWVLDGRALLYSVYAANPGVGADNPSFLLSALDGKAEPFGLIAQRAQLTADEIVRTCVVAKPRALAASGHAPLQALTAHRSEK